MNAERDAVMANQSVRLSFYLAVTLQNCIERNTHFVKVFHYLVGT